MSTSRASDRTLKRRFYSSFFLACDASLLQVEFALDPTLSEAVAIKRALEPIERAAAKVRIAIPEKFSDLSKGNALDKIAKATGVHRTTLAKAEASVDAAEAEPEKYSRLLADMDRTGRAKTANCQTLVSLTLAPAAMAGSCAVQSSALRLQSRTASPSRRTSSSIR